MRVLVAIANYGSGNRQYIDRLIAEYRRMRFDTDIVVLSDREKTLTGDVEVRVGLPTADPWSLPFAHKSLFAERCEDYDLFVYSEDDTLVTESHLDAFLAATAQVPHPRVVGFMRYEQDQNGERYSSSVHSYFHWKPDTVERFGPYTVAEFTNAHAAAFVLTREQLRAAIESGGFLVEPHSGHYDLACTAATDPYTQCGMRKVVCVSDLDDFLLHHLPDKYVGKMGIPIAELKAQVAALIDGRCDDDQQLFPTEPLLAHSRHNRSYHEYGLGPLDSLLGQRGTVLSYGCGWGRSERALMDRGFDVTAVPVDSVIAESAKAHGVRVVARDEIPDASFDIVLLPDIVSRLEDPTMALSELRKKLTATGRVLGWTSNFRYLPFRHDRHELERQGFAQTRLHATTARRIRRWFRDAGCTARVWHDTAPKHRWLSGMTLGLGKPLVSNRLVFEAFPQQPSTR